MEEDQVVPTRKENCILPSKCGLTPEIQGDSVLKDAIWKSEVREVQAGFLSGLLRWSWKDAFSVQPGCVPKLCICCLIKT